ncbi:hypothetical protein AO239_19290 [Pseudomonas sp. ICMP 19500]|nr:hypothetical protein PD374_12745 [Pseudomonas sp. WCS374]EPJ78843.1 hypothetical protein CFT9_24064 [Pseudomonas sp. CFT9]KTC29183.1 hypothetical protein AO239_19290 [Pseudomonas sp. ICMP 19500]OKP72419.1 hypothetical protein BTR19_09175 [Pseudomonas fluorescens]
MSQARVISAAGRVIVHLHCLPGIQINVTAAGSLTNTLGICGPKRIARYPHCLRRQRPRQIQRTYVRDPKRVAVPGALHALTHRLKGRNQTAIVPDHDGVGTQADT